MSHEVPPGWYPDPYGTDGLLRWWDGVQWSTFTQEAPEAEPVETASTEIASTEAAPVEAAPAEVAPGGLDTEDGPVEAHGPSAHDAPHHAAPRGGVPHHEAPGRDLPHHEGRTSRAPLREAPAGPATRQEPPEESFLPPAYGELPAYGGPRRRGRRPWLAAGGLLAVAAAVAVLFLTTGIGAPDRAGGDRGGDGPPAARQPTPALSRPSRSPVIGRIDDPAAGLSYARLGGGWSLMSRGQLRTMRWSAGQYQTAQENYNGKGDDSFVSCLSSPLPDNFPYAGSGDLADTSAAVARAIEKTFYPAHTRHDVASRAIDVDGHQAWLRTYTLSYPHAREKGYDFRGETVTVVLVDRGRQRPGVLWASVPDNRERLLPDVDTVISSLRVT